MSSPRAEPARGARGRRPRVALIHPQDARDVRTWSGTVHFSKGAIDRHVGPVADLTPAPVRLLPFRVARKLVRSATGKEYSYDHEPLLARWYGRYFSRLLARERPDLVFAPAGSSCVAYLETDAPVVYYSDSTWRMIRGYYPNYTDVVERNARAAEEMERRTLARSAVALFASDWAAESAVRDYGADPARVHTVYIGANLPDPPRRADVLPRAPGSPVRLLFVGVLWEVKGGEIAFETLLHLRALGIDAELTVVGCTPPPHVRHPALRVVPFLNKQVPEERREFERLWREADFFVLPSRCECAGVVYCEAAAYALPVLATRTGGVASLVREGVNGYTLPPEARGPAYAERIAEVLGDPGRYEALCEASRAEFESRLSWDAWGRRVSGVLAELGIGA
ncbi:MAG TPA: glycosyltransferase family 4 protein [Longimicrobiaceae bacterium]|nr:glycosyltransferase family 4 protein [Longimicrobiaceae bacterium]